MRIIAYRTQVDRGKILLKESTGESIHSARLDELFSFLLEPQAASDWQPQYDKCLRVFWELDVGVAPILKLMGERKCQMLHLTNKCYYAPFNIFYIPGKIFSVEHIPSKSRANLYDLMQYFPELNEPDALEGVQMLGEKLQIELKKMGLEPHKLTSPVAVYEDCVLSFLDLPRLEDIPKEVAVYAGGCMGRSWVESYQLGYFKEAFDYDLQGAYPSVAKDLVDFRVCEWVWSTKRPASAIYGYTRSLVTIYDWVAVHPILYETDNGSLETRTGTWERYTQMQEIDFIEKWGIGECEIMEGWWCVPPRHKGGLPKPLKLSTERILAYKQRTGLQRAMAKRMSMFAGKFGEQRKNGFGPYFNPVWKAEINTLVNLQVAEWLYQHGIGPEDNEGYQHLIHISVDGCLLDASAETNGQWRLGYVGPALSVSSGLVFYADKKP